MISAGRLHALWRALPIGSMDDVIGAGTRRSWHRIPTTKALVVAA